MPFLNFSYRSNMLKFSNVWRFSKISVECSVHILRCPWYSLETTVKSIPKRVHKHRGDRLAICGIDKLMWKASYGFLTAITLQIDVPIGWSNLGFISFLPIISINTHGLLYFLWINHSFPNFENTIFYKIFWIPAMR